MPFLFSLLGWWNKFVRYPYNRRNCNKKLGSDKYFKKGRVEEGPCGRGVVVGGIVRGGLFEEVMFEQRTKPSAQWSCECVGEEHSNKGIARYSLR